MKWTNGELVEIYANAYDNIQLAIDELNEVDRNNFVHTELGNFKGRKMDIAFVNKFNELVRAVNSLEGKNE